MDEQMETVTIAKVAEPAPVNPKLAALRARAAGGENDRFITAEEWAEAKGFLPEFIVPPSPVEKPKKAMRRVHNPRAAQFGVARFFFTWPIGKELTEAEFDAAVAKANDPKQNTFR